MNLPYIDRIWRLRGQVQLAPATSAAEAFERLDDLLREKNTICRIDGDTLTFSKKNAVPQDKLSVFDGGTLKVENNIMRYDVKSRALLACFLAPLFFYGLGLSGVAIDQWRNPPEVVKAKEEAAKRRSLVKPEDVPMNAIDQFLGAPVPEKKKDGEQIGKRNRKPSMRTAYTYMGIFTALYIIGRILEHRLLHSRLRKRLGASEAQQPASAAPPTGLDNPFGAPAQPAT